LISEISTNLELALGVINELALKLEPTEKETEANE